MLRLLANENIPRLLVERLRERGHDVRWASEDMRGRPDRELLATARTEHRVLLTCDRDFGQLVFRQGVDGSCGVVLIRLASRSQRDFVEQVIPALEAVNDPWSGHFAVIEHDRIRVVPLPSR